MRLVRFCPERSTANLPRLPEAERAYRRFRIGFPYFLSDVRYDTPAELARAILGRESSGRKFSGMLRDRLDELGWDVGVEERSKKLLRVCGKLTRPGRSLDLLPDFVAKIIQSLGIQRHLHPIGSIRDWYGIRMIYPDNFRDCYKLLELALELAGVTDCFQIVHFRDMMVESRPRFDEDGGVVGVYRAIHASVIFEGVPMEVQIRSETNDHLAKTTIKRPGLD